MRGQDRFGQVRTSRDMLVKDGRTYRHTDRWASRAAVAAKNRSDCEKINHMRKEKYDGRRVEPHNSAPYDLTIVMLCI